MSDWHGHSDHTRVGVAVGPGSEAGDARIIGRYTDPASYAARVSSANESLNMESATGARTQPLVVALAQPGNAPRNLPYDFLARRQRSRSTAALSLPL